MKFVIDLDTLAILEAVSSGKRGDSTPFELIFQRSGIPEQLPAGTEVIFAAKLAGQYDGDALIHCDEFTRSSTGTDAKYLGTPSLNGEALNALFLTDGNPANDVKFLELMAEFSWSVPPAAPITSDTFPFLVKNDIWKGTEGTPVALPTPEAWLLGITAPVNGATAALDVDLTGANNGIRLAAVATGSAGNSVTVQLVEYVTGLDIITTDQHIEIRYLQGVDTATDVITLLNADSQSSLLVDASNIPGSDGSGTLPVGGTAVLSLAGGQDATAAPPYLRVHGGFLYIQEAGVWKKAALSAL